MAHLLLNNHKKESNKKISDFAKKISQAEKGSQALFEMMNSKIQNLSNDLFAFTRFKAHLQHSAIFTPINEISPRPTPFLP